MATRKIADLTHSLPNSGQYDLVETGTSGLKYVGMPTYDPDAHEAVIVEKGTNRVLGGSHRVYCWNEEMNLSINDAYPEDDQTEIEVIEMTKAEYGKKMVEDTLEPGDIAQIPNRQEGWTPSKWRD